MPGSNRNRWKNAGNLKVVEECRDSILKIASRSGGHSLVQATSFEQLRMLSYDFLSALAGQYRRQVGSICDTSLKDLLRCRRTDLHE